MAEEHDSGAERELLEQLQEEMRRITVPDYLRHLLVSLSSLAFQRLGLTAESVEGRDLGQARMAIDAFEALSSVLKEVLPDEEAGLYSSTLHQLRMAFVRASSSGGGGDGKAVDGAATEPPASDKGAADDHPAMDEPVDDEGADDGES